MQCSHPQLYQSESHCTARSSDTIRVCTGAGTLGFGIVGSCFWRMSSAFENESARTLGRACAKIVGAAARLNFSMSLEHFRAVQEDRHSSCFRPLPLAIVEPSCRSRPVCAGKQWMKPGELFRNGNSEERTVPDGIGLDSSPFSQFVIIYSAELES